VQRGEWYDPHRVNKYNRAVYKVTFEQLLRISDLQGEKHAEVELYQVSGGKIKKISYRALVEAWYDAIPAEKKKKWLDQMLEEMLFNQVMESPYKFL